MNTRIPAAKHPLLFAVTALLALTCTPKLNAQTSTGVIVGTVLDAAGAVVPNAKVQSKNLENGVVSAATASGEGQYRIANLVVGRYSVSASAPGFQSTALQNIAVDANKTVTVNITLEIGTVTTTLDVTGTAAVIDTTTATIQNTFSTDFARDIPLSNFGMGVANLSLLGAGVASNGNLGVGEGPSIGGQRPYNNNFMIEGVDSNNKSVTGSLIRFIPNDAVAQFSVLQNQEGAEYGHSSGGQFNTILKSGTNSFHGTAYEYLQNRNLDAIDQTVQNQAIANGVRPSNPRSDNNRFGGSFGGPILKDKLFFYGLYEYNPVGASATPAAVSAPTAQGYSLLSGLSGLSATNLGVFKQYTPTAAAPDPSLLPYPVVNGVTIPIGTLQFASPNYQNNQSLVTTFDYNVSSRDQLRGRYIYNRLAQIDTGATLPQFYTFNNNVYHVASLAEYHNFSPNLNNELRLGYNRLNQPLDAGPFKFPGLDAFPDIVLNDLGLDIGPNPQSPQGIVQNTYQLQDNVTWVKGAHTLQFGFDGRRYISPQTFTQRSRGDYEYNDLTTFLHDVTPDSLAQRSTGNPVYYGDQYATYEYAQDTWRYRPNLTFNLGLRYEYTTIPVGEKSQILNAISNVPGLLTFGVPKAQTKNFAPRIGIAYSPGSQGTTSVRAGFGTAYDVLYDNIGILSLPPQLSTTVDITAPLGTGSPNFLKNGGILPGTSGGPPLTAAQSRARTAAYVQDQTLPYSINWNIGVQHVVASNYTFEVRYLGTRGVHLDVQSRLNKRTVITPTNSLPTYLAAPSQAALDSLPLTLAALQGQSNILPAFLAAGFTNGAFVSNVPRGWSSYHGLAFQANRRFSNGLQFQAAYTWSHLIDNSTADFNTTALSPRRAQDFQNYTAEKASSALDRRHRFSIAAYYEAPWFRRSNWIAKNLVGNWTIAPVYTYESPEFATVQSAIDSNLNGDPAADRSIINPAGISNTSSDVTALKNSSGDTVAYLATKPNAQYIKAGLGAYANGGRNTLAGRPVDDVDLSLYKNFNLSERFRLQFGAVFNNLLNHPQFTPGFANRIDAVSSSYNNGAAVRNYLTPGNPIFNRPEALFSSHPRQVQLGLKLVF